MSRFLELSKTFETLKFQGRILFALLALLGASLASAKESVVWKTSMDVKLPSVSVLMGREFANPTYYVTLPGGRKVELKQSTPVDVKGLSPADVAQAGEDARVILGKVLQIVLARDQYAFVYAQGEKVHAAQVDPNWLSAQGLRIFDPISTAMEERSPGREFADKYEFANLYELSPELAKQAERDVRWSQTRTRRILVFLRDAVYTSTIDAFKAFRASNNDLKGHVQEFGIQIAFRGELQIGVGKLSITKNFPLLLSVGYNREKRTITFRRSFRTEKMAGGTALSLAGKFEVRWYRLVADVADAGDARKGYAGLKGQSWYPPALPFISPVMDSAPGYQSAGVAFGVNLADVVPGMYLMNTVTSFKDEQRVYTAEIPDPPAWFKKLHEQLNESASMFSGSSRGARCEMLFRPSFVN